MLRSEIRATVGRREAADLDPEHQRPARPQLDVARTHDVLQPALRDAEGIAQVVVVGVVDAAPGPDGQLDRKSTRLNSSH